MLSMVDESSNKPKLFLARKKSWHSSFFFVFSSDMLKSLDFFFTKSVGYLLNVHRNFLKITRISRRQPATRFLFYFFPPTKAKNLCRDPSTIEYTENGLMSPLPLRSHKDRSPLQGHFWESLLFRLHSKLAQIHLSIEAQCDHHTNRAL